MDKRDDEDVEGEKEEDNSEEDSLDDSTDEADTDFGEGRGFEDGILVVEEDMVHMLQDVGVLVVVARTVDYPEDHTAGMGELALGVVVWDGTCEEACLRVLVDIGGPFGDFGQLEWVVGLPERLVVEDLKIVDFEEVELLQVELVALEIGDFGSLGLVGVETEVGLVLEETDSVDLKKKISIT